MILVINRRVFELIEIEHSEFVYFDEQTKEHLPFKGVIKQHNPLLILYKSIKIDDKFYAVKEIFE